MTGASRRPPMLTTAAAAIGMTTCRHSANGTTGRRLSANLRLVEPPFVRSCAYPRSARPAYCERYILRSMAEPLNPAERVVPDPEHGWAGADLAEDELVDDGFIATACRRAYKPLQPEDDKLYPPVEGGEA